MNPLPNFGPPYSPHEWAALTRAAALRAHALRDEALQHGLDAGLRALRHAVQRLASRLGHARSSAAPLEA